MQSTVERPPSPAAVLAPYTNDPQGLALLLTETLPAACIDELNKTLTRRSIFNAVERTERVAAYASRR